MGDGINLSKLLLEYFIFFKTLSSFQFSFLSNLGFIPPQSILPYGSVLLVWRC